MKDHYSGGDLVFPRMQRFFGKNILISLIGSREAIEIWKKYKLRATYHIYSESSGTHQIRFAPIIYFSRNLKAIKILFSLLKKQKGRSFIYSSSDYFPDVLPGFFAKIFFNKKVVWVGRVYHIIPLSLGRGNIFYTLFSFLSQRLSLRLFNQADIVFVLQGACKALEKYRICTLVVPTYIGADASRVRHTPKPSFTAVSVGSIHGTRGMGDLLPIWKEVVEKIPSVKLLVIGGGETEEVNIFKQTIKQLKLDKHILYAGFVSDDKKIHQYISQSKLYLCPNREGGGMMPVAEAMRLGIPTIAYELPVFGEMYTKGYKTVPLGNKQLFAQTIVTLMKNKKAYTRLSKEARIEAKKFNWKIIANEFLSVIKQNSL